MSLSWANLVSTNQLLVFLGADDVAVIHQSQGLRNRVIDQKQVTFPVSIEGIKIEAPVWQQSTIQLERLLSAMQLQPGTRLTITLASEFVRYLSLPALQIRMNATEKLDYIAAAYQDIYGEVVNDWEINCHDAPSEEAILAAAIDKKLMAELNQIALKHQLILHSVQPYLMRAFNALASQINDTNGYLVLVESKRLLLINLQDRKYQNLRTYAVGDGDNWQSELKNLMLREALLSNFNKQEMDKQEIDKHEIDKQEILVYAPTQKNIALKVIDGWHLKRISTLKNVITNIQYSMLEVSL